VLQEKENQEKEQQKTQSQSKDDGISQQKQYFILESTPVKAKTKK
jgi:hypothetical protein